MLQFALLAFILQVNQPSYQITEAIHVMQEKVTVQATSLEENDFIAYDINLDEEIQRHIWNEANKYELSYELLLSIAYVESKYDPSVVSWDGSSTGLFQLNTRNTVEWLARETGIKNVNPKNPYHSASMAAWYVNYLREKYINEGYDEESATNRILLAYRFGVAGSKGRSMNHPYVKAVLKYKNNLETGVIYERTDF